MCPAFTFRKTDHSSFYLFNLLLDVRHKVVSVLTSSFANGLKWTPAGLAKGSPASRTQGKLAAWHRSVKSPCVKRAEYQARPQHLFSNVRGFCPDLILSLAGISSFPLLPPKWGQTPCMVSSFSVCQLPSYSHSSQRFCALESDVPWERALLTSSPASFCVQTPPKPCPAMALQIHLAKDKILLSSPLCND